MTPQCDIRPVRAQHFVFLTLPNYSFIALSSALEALRMANRVVRHQAYKWTVVSLNGVAEVASNGLQLAPTVALDTAGRADIVFVCGGDRIEKNISRELISVLRHLGQHQKGMGALCSGAYALAQAGLLDGRRAVIHWEYKTTAREQFERVIFSDHLFAVDGNRYTCSGGTTPLDLMIHLIEMKWGSEVALQISEGFFVERIRTAQDRQHIPLKARVGLFQENLMEAAALMEANVEEPLPLAEIATLAKVSRRQLERLFNRYVGSTPTQYYVSLRLKRARSLLLQSALPIMDIANICGFQNLSYFSKCYRQNFGHAPSAERRSNGINF